VIRKFCDKCDVFLDSTNQPGEVPVYINKGAETLTITVQWFSDYTFKVDYNIESHLCTKCIVDALKLCWKID
jgi:hypothetical protein